jgi:putative hydrolase of the HAD superfamily
MLQALVFDLDDTLYVERHFVMSGYRAVARYLENEGCCPFERAFSIMVDAFDASGRQAVFPTLLEQHPRISLSIAELVAIYRKHEPAIHLYPGYLQLLRKLSRDYRLGVITDGLPAVQERKIRALGLQNIMNRIIYTWEYGSEKEKPHPLSFSLMLDFLRAGPDATIYIGDNPEKDCKGAHGVGMKFAQVRRPYSRDDDWHARAEEPPEFVLDTLFQLPDILQRMN